MNAIAPRPLVKIPGLRGSQRLGKKVRPIRGPLRHRGKLLVKRLLAFAGIALESPRDRIDIVDSPEPARDRSSQVNVDDDGATRADTIHVAVKGFVDQGIARDCVEAAAVTGFMAAATHQQRRVTGQVMMAEKRPSRLVEADLLTRKDKRHQLARKSGGMDSAWIIANASSTLIIF